jgi:hypothetical protein
MSLIRPGGDVTTAPPIPYGQPLGGRFIKADPVFSKDDTDDDGNLMNPDAACIAVRFTYVVDDDDHADLKGTFVDTTAWMNPRPALKYAAHCEAIGVGDPNAEWDAEAFKSAEVMLVLNQRKDRRTGEMRPDISQVYRRG